MQDMIITTLRDAVHEQRGGLDNTTMTVDRLNTELSRFKSNIDTRIARLTPMVEYKKFVTDTEEK